jgi:putative transposase
MQLTERHIIKSTEHRFAQIDSLAFKSKNLYNAANYVIRQSFIYGWGPSQLQRNEPIDEIS